MAKKERWITVNGNHILIKDGQSVNDAIQERFGDKKPNKKRINNGKYEYSKDGSDWEDMDEDSYNELDVEEDRFDDNIEDDFGFDKEDEQERYREAEHAMDGEEEDDTDGYMKGEMFYDGEHAYKITDVNDEEIEFINEKGQKRVAPLEEFRNMVESDEYDTHGVTMEEAKNLGLDLDNWNPVEGESAVAKETWPPQDLKQYMKKTDNGYSFDMNVLKDKSVEELSMLLEHPDAQNNLVIKNAVMSAIYQKNREEPEYKNGFNQIINQSKGSEDDDIKMPTDEEVQEQRLKEAQEKTEKEFPEQGDAKLEAEIDNLLEKEKPYKALHDYEDFEDARFYPTKDTMEGNRWVGRHYSIAEAHGLNDRKNWSKENEIAKPAGNYNGYSIYQLPDGYFSINPNITDMSFKSKEALQNYLDKKNPEEHKYGVYFKPNDEREYVYHGKDENGKEYDMEAPDAYKAARTKKPDLNKKIEEQVDDGVTEDDIGYLRQVLNETGINQLTNDQIRKIISSIRNRK